jgi:hypothetical protein
MINQEAKVEKSAGLNESEKRLVKLGKKVFLELWSYPNVYYKPGKELTDLLVVCDNHVLIFSDKKIKFNMNIDVSVAWKRWHNKAVIESIQQLRKAEQKIKMFPEKIFLDPQCKQKLHVPLPQAKDMKIHLICVANGAKEACKKRFGVNCTGSLMFTTDLEKMKKSKEYYKKLHEETENKVVTTENQLANGEFYITDYDNTKTFIHVFDDFSFPFVLNELDTLRDFVNYLEEKEIFIRKAKGVSYTGEEDLLYHYIRNYDERRRRHTFVNAPDRKIKETFCTFFEEDWNNLWSNPQYLSKKNADRISYVWDSLIQRTGFGILSGETKSEHPKGNPHEGALRYMALEDRTSRRLLCERLKQAYDSYPIDIVPKDVDLPYVSLYYDYTNREQVYFFLQLKQLSTDSYATYRKKRRDLIEAYGMCLKAKFVDELPQHPLKRIIAIGIEPVKYSKTTSEDIAFIDCSQWTDEQQQRFRELRNIMKIWRTPLDKATKFQAKEYPDVVSKKVGRNAPCPCQSGKKYKKCCGR